MERQRVFPVLEAIQQIPGVELEDKNWSAAVHFRKVVTEDRVLVASELENLHIQHGVSLHYGPDVAEVQFLQEVSKEIALKTLVKLFGHRPTGRNLVYAGDDQNDAQAMRWVLDRNGIVYVVGDRIAVTGANVVAGPTDLARALRRRFSWIGEERNHQNESTING
jgi:trehalose 6-phosphate phosphatase